MLYVQTVMLTEHIKEHRPGAKMQTFFTSDTHFGHTNIIKYCNRPFSDVDEMNREMAKIWNEIVGFRDTVYHLGDFAFGNLTEIERYRKKLNGKIILVKGNHDKGGLENLQNIFDEVVTSASITDGEDILHMQHFPMPDPLDNYPNHYYLNGHVHDKWKTSGRRINVGVDVWDLKPRTWAELKTAVKG